MRFLIFSSAWCVFLHYAYAYGEHITTFQATFIQRTISQNNTLVYSGKISIKAPSQAKWIYEKPVRKELYIRNDEAIFYEPLLEQASIGTSSIDVMDIFHQAKKQKNGSYIANVGNTRYILFVNNKQEPKKLTFIDDFDNNVEITFRHVVINAPISDKEFIFIPPPHIDIIQHSSQ